MARLTELTVRSARPGRYVDGEGLMLIVSAPRERTLASGEVRKSASGKKWVLRYQAAGKSETRGSAPIPP
jgi:hypothetical protein